MGLIRTSPQYRILGENRRVNRKCGYIWLIIETDNSHETELIVNSGFLLEWCLFSISWIVNSRAAINVAMFQLDAGRKCTATALILTRLFIGDLSKQSQLGSSKAENVFIHSE